MSEPYDLGTLSGMLDERARQSKEAYAASLRRVAEADAEYRAKLKDYRETVERNKISQAEDERKRNTTLTVIVIGTLVLIALGNIVIPH